VKKMSFSDGALVENFLSFFSEIFMAKNIFFFFELRRPKISFTSLIPRCIKKSKSSEIEQKFVNSKVFSFL